jgi:hypothetical protein
MAFYVITQGPFYKKSICQINFGNNFYLHHMCFLWVYNFLPHSQQPRNAEKRKKKRLVHIKQLAYTSCYKPLATYKVDSDRLPPQIT